MRNDQLEDTVVDLRVSSLKKTDISVIDYINSRQAFAFYVTSRVCHRANDLTLGRAPVLARFWRGRPSDRSRSKKALRSCLEARASQVPFESRSRYKLSQEAHDSPAANYITLVKAAVSDAPFSECVVQLNAALA